MKINILTIVISILSITNVYSSDDDYIEKVFKSPAGDSTIIYKGAYHRGLGTFYIKQGERERKIISTKVYYGPMIKWHSKNYVELFIPYGSPFNGSYIYKINEHKITEFIENVLFIDTNSEVVYFSDFTQIFIKNIFGGKILQKFKLDGYTGGMLSRAEHYEFKVDQKYIYIKTIYSPFDYEESSKPFFYKFKREY